MQVSKSVDSNRQLTYEINREDKRNLQFPLKHPVEMIHIYSKRAPLCKQWFSKIQETPRQLAPREIFEMAAWSVKETPGK